ncbi:MAG: hypothetical protein R3D51_13780 [Hyphomicrobiaceae bacterium]
MRKVLLGVLLGVATTGSAIAADSKSFCPEGPATITGTIGVNRLFDPPDYWVGESMPCRIHLIELDAPDATCVEGAKFSVTGKVEYVKEDGEISLVQIVKPDKLTCEKK